MSDVRLEIDIPENLPESLPVLALRRGTLLPGGGAPFTVGRPKSLSALEATRDQLLLVALQREAVRDPSPADLLPTAVLARVALTRRGENGTTIAIIGGLARVRLTGFPSSKPHFEATYELIEEEWPETADADALADVLRETVEETIELLGGTAIVQPILHKLAERMPLLVDAVAAQLKAPEAWRRELLATLDPVKRAQTVLDRLVRTREAIAARKSIRDRIEGDVKGAQREAMLRQQLDAIQSELGGEHDELAELTKKLEQKNLPDEVRATVDRELGRLGRINKASPERNVAIDWLTWINDLPWGEESGMGADLGALETALDESHFGLEDVKRQVVEHLAVRKLSGSGRADVLLLVGPPGVGKTSIGQAIADATGRKLVRVALGGMRDEAELRGHRRTYIGARPGRLIEGIRRAGTSDPVVLLDELDKLAHSAFGNPSAALLEILDPEQNANFVDRYLEVPFDLSKVLFVATANELGKIPGPLRDRMEVLRIEGYTRSEKIRIARDHLLTKIAGNAGLSEEAVAVTDDIIGVAIDGWTREAGVRELQRMLGKLYRAAAVKEAKGTLEPPLVISADELDDYLGRRRFHDDDDIKRVDRPGVATGLAWTPVGGDVLFIEASTLPGRGQLILTGQLGDVMKESARAALTYVLAHHERLDIAPDVLEHQDVHIHVPAGGVPKDGPSAGVTMFTALASLLSGRVVRADTAMTGEATLRGRVLPVGGIKAKVLAAHRRGLKRIILPRRNGLDLHDVPKEALEELEIILVDHMGEALTAALAPQDLIAGEPEQATWAAA
jgi:ATP-dependent Lon protease